MRRITALLILGCALSLSLGQYIETTILLPDSTSGLTSVGSLVFHSPTNTMYVGGNESFLVAANAQTNAKLTRVGVGPGPHLLCSAPPENKIYCANNYATITAVDGGANQAIKTITVEETATDLVYNEREGKLYCGNLADSLVRVIDCASDSVVARVPVSFGPGALCYNPQLNRLYCAHSATDEVTVIDCSADTVVDVVWVRGVRPCDICFDSASNCVYTANSGSGTVSVIDCATDTLLRLVAAERGPKAIIAGPAGKVYCANYDDASVSVITDSGVKAVSTGRRPVALSFDPVNTKVYCGCIYRDSVAVIDADQDTLVAKIQVGSHPSALCHNPAGNNTYVACSGDDVASAIGGVSDSVEALIPLYACNPGPLCYNTTNNHLYCLDQTRGMLFVIDGDSNRVLKTLRTGSGSNTLIWNPVGNKVYVTNSESSSVSILDCASDSIKATVETGYRPHAMSCSGDGKVYVAWNGGVDVIDGSGDTIRAVVPIPASYYDPSSLCYNWADMKMYVGTGYGETAMVRVIDTQGDSISASIAVFALYAYNLALCWNQNHDKLYACSWGCDSLVVVDCAGDSVLRIIRLPGEIVLLRSNSVCDKVYCADWQYHTLRIINAATDAFTRSLPTGGEYALLDNGKQGPASRLYCVSDEGDVAVVRGYKTDSVICRVPVGDGPCALAWNPAHSRMYVSNSGSSSISVIRDTFGVGVDESPAQAQSYKLQVTVVRGSLELGVGSRQQTGYRAELLDISGRKVLDLKSGSNDVRALAPGVYFIREAQAQAQAVRKVVVTR